MAREGRESEPAGRATCCDDRPARLSVMFLILLASSPSPIAFGGFNQLSGDIANRGLRTCSCRTGRLNLVLARLLGTFVFSAVTSLFTMAVGRGVPRVPLSSFYPLGDLVRWGLWGWAADQPLQPPVPRALPLDQHRASRRRSPPSRSRSSRSACRSSRSTTSSCHERSRSTASLTWLDKITPWGWNFDLLHPDPGTVASRSRGHARVLRAFLVPRHVRHFLKRDL